MENPPAKRTLPWLLPTLVLLAIVAGLAYGAIQSRRNTAPPVTIQISPEVTMHLRAVLTAANPVYENRAAFWEKHVLTPRVRRFIPMPLRKYLPSPVSAYRENYSGGPGGARFVFQFDVPATWSGTPHGQVSAVLDKTSLRYTRLQFAPGFTSGKEYINLSSSGSPGDQLVWGTAQFDSIPVNFETLKFQLMESADYESTAVAKEVTLPNPVYQKVTPIEPTQQLPVTASHDNMEMTMRGLVAQVQKDAQLINTTRTPEYKGSGALPGSLFPKGNPDEGYRTILAFNLKNNDPAASNWQPDWPVITYGREKFPFKLNSFGTRHNNNVILLELGTDLSRLPQPLQVSIPLRRKDKFPADEEQVLELPLPQDGTSTTTDITVALWDNNIRFLGISNNEPGYKPANYRHFSPTHYGAGKYLSLFYSADKHTQLQDITLTGPEDKSFDLSYSGISSSYNRNQVILYDLTREYYSQELHKSVKLNPEEYTTITMQLRSPRPFTKTFDFVLNTELATGGPEKNQ